VRMAQQPHVTIGSSELRRMLQNFPDSIQSMIPDITDKDQENREAVLAIMAERVNGGDPVAGQKVFRTGRIACTTCHTVKGDGGQVGPDLTKIGAIRNGRDLLEAIIYPSASFARGYRSYSVVTGSGKVHTGLIERQSSNELVLKTRDLKQLRIPTSEIDELVESPVSIMPKGLETVLTENELRDLLAYLQQLK
jgi:putative heme-binding domain-containing protein